MGMEMGSAGDEKRVQCGELLLFIFLGGGGIRAALDRTK